MLGDPNKLDYPKAEDKAAASPVNFKIIIPSTRSGSIHIKESTFQKRVDEVADYVTKLFEGSTISKGFGTYTSDDKKTVGENVAVISVFTKQDVYNRHDIDLLQYLKSRRRAWTQWSMGFEYQGVFYLIKAREKKKAGEL